ncbi:MAG: 50S ribosomal protein L3 [Candidatus Aenigmatarchaeota archaeon]
MAKGHKPRAGSRAFWPRKRAKRIYPRLKHSTELERISSKIKETKPLAFAGYKAGMTHVLLTEIKKRSVAHGLDLAKAVSVIECPPLYVCGINLYTKDAYGYKMLTTIWSKNLKKDILRKLDVPNKIKDIPSDDIIKKVADIRLLVHTQPRETGVGKKKPEVFEIDLSGTVEEKWKYAKEKLGKEIDISEVFSEGEYVDVKAVTKGKGYQGVVKRFGVKIRNRKSKEKRRHLGTLGPITPSRVLPGKIAFPGQMGFQTRTEFNKRIIKIGKDGVKVAGGFVNYGEVKKNYVLIEGSVPGAKKRLIILRKSFRKTNLKEPAEVKYIHLGSQQ